MNQIVTLSRSEMLAAAVLESHFSLVDQPGTLDLITVNGAAGWTSPNPHPVLSLMRWTSPDQKTAEVALDEILAMFREKGCGFDWMTGPDTAHLAPLLYERGFLKPPLEVSAMAITLTEPVAEPLLDGMQIWKVEDPTDMRIASVMAKGFDVPDDVGAIYHDAYMTPSKLQKTDVYAVSDTRSDTPVAVGYLSYIGDGQSALLRVSSTSESHRGRGLYQALVLHRMRETAKTGRNQVFVQAYSEGSKRALSNLGFKHAGILQLHRWRP